MNSKADAVQMLRQYIQNLKEAGTTEVLDFQMKPKAAAMLRAAAPTETPKPAPFFKPEPATAPAVVPAAVPTASYPSLEAMEKAIHDCKKCALGQTRTHFVFGEGDPKASLVFVGEAPGAEEDKEGRPFVGEAGKLLTKIIEAMGLKREEVFICNVLKCRPAHNRDPLPTEVTCCLPYLDQQLALIQPRVICALGNHAAQNLLKTAKPIGQLRGRVHDHQGIKIVPTYHPAACLYNPDNKKFVWQDMKLIMEILKSSR